MSKRLSRLTVIVATVAGLAAATGTAAASPADRAFESRSDNAPGGVATQVDDTRPAGAGQGRKVG
jgi:hypothetical protein